MGDDSRAESGQRPFGAGYAAALATRLARIAPGDLDAVHLCDTAAQAVEMALTLARRAQGLRRSAVAYASRSPRTGIRRALSVPGATHHRSPLHRCLLHRSPLRRVRGDVQVPFGDLGALADALHKRRIGTVILETAQSSPRVDPPRPDYLREVRRLCDEREALWIADEVACGVGRTGRLFAFEHAGVRPDVVALARSLGVGATGIGAVIARGPVHRRAYPDTASAISLEAFGGSAEACRAALEALTALCEQDLIGNAERTGRYLLRRLEGLRLSYPHLVTDVRGMGLLVGVRLTGADAGRAGPPDPTLPEGRLRGGLAGMVATLLLAEHGVLVAFTDHDRDGLRLEPPLTIRPEHVDHFVDALDELLSRGPRRLAHDYLRVVQAGPADPLSPCG